MLLFSLFCATATAQAQKAPDSAPSLPPLSSTPPVFAASIHPTADLRMELVADRLDTLDSRVSTQSPSVFFTVSRARMGFAGSLAPSLSFLARLEVRQASQEVEYRTYAGDGFSLQTYPEGWRIQLYDLASTWDCGALGTWTFGLQPKEFGLRSWYTEPYYLGGTHHYQSMVEAKGVVPAQTLGLTWSREIGSLATTWVQVSNTTSSTPAETQAGKDLSARVHLDLFEPLTIMATALTGPRDVYGRQVAWSVAAEGRRGATKGLMEYIEDTRGDSQGAGWGLTLSHERPLAQSLESAETLLRIRSWDPDNTKGEDRTVEVAAALLIHWTTLGRSSLSTGLTYEIKAPEDTYAAIEHEVIGAVRVQF
jgi:hypothetical protein